MALRLLEQISDIQQLLQDSNVDFRDCYEKTELIDRLRTSESGLPAYVQNRLRRLLTSSDTQEGLREARGEDLSQEEDQAVRLFNVSSKQETCVKMHDVLCVLCSDVDIVSSTSHPLPWGLTGSP